MAEDLRYALNSGTTLTMRALLSFAATLQGLGYLAEAPNWLSAAAYADLNELIPFPVWGAAYLTVGVAGMWRVLSKNSRPGLAWAVNIATSLVWTSGLIVRLLLGPSSLLSLYTAIAIAAFWCLLRTEATERDTRTA